MKLEDNREVWSKRVEEFKSSKLTQVAWCRENGIKAGALRYWIKKLDDSATPTDESSPKVKFASLTFEAKDSSSSIELEINNIKLSITDNYDELLLLKLINSLRKL